MNMFDKQLAFAIRGVTYPSDSDPQPLERFRWNVTETTIDEGTVCEWSGESIDGPTTVLNYTEFMAPRMTTGDQVPQYVTINGIMTGNLTDLTVYRFGSVNVRFYVMGLDAIGNITGWKTSAVQS